MTIVKVCEIAAPPCAGWKVTVTDTGRPRRRRRALAIALRPARVGMSTSFTEPGEATALLPLAKTIADGRHLPRSFTKPRRHFEALAAKTPKRPLANVESHLNMPPPETDAENVITPLAGSTESVEVKPLVAALPAVPPAPAESL